MNNIKSARSIKIAGGGIAGLSAAIKLKLNGFDPIIYEKEDKIGLGRHDDFEGIENWIFSNEMQTFFKKIGFDFNKIDSYPISRFTIHTISKEPFRIFQNKPFFYMIKRGSSYNSLDTQLFNQCAEGGVKFNFGQMAPNDCEIIIFPSHVEHEVTRNMSGELRCCIAFNYFVEGTISPANGERLSIRV